MPTPERLQSMCIICCFIIFALHHQPASTWRIERYYHSADTPFDEDLLLEAPGPSVQCGASNYSGRGTFFDDEADYDYAGNDEAFDCTVEPGANLIGGGFDLKPGQFPSFVYIEMLLKSHGPVWCGGSILDERHILSAAHCFQETSGQNTSKEIQFITVYAGFISKDDYSRQYFVESVCSPKEFQMKPNYDVAVLKLTDPIEFDNQVQPVCLPSFGIDYGQQVVSIGMGYLSNNTGKPVEATKLQGILMTKIAPQQCEAGPLSTGNLEFCLGTERGQICQGDSGGPALASVQGKQTIFGITSRIKEFKCIPGDSGWSINTDISKPEIRNIINKCLTD